MKNPKVFRKSTKLNYDIPRKIFVNGIIPDTWREEVPPHRFIDNRIKTSRYTVLNFFPKNLFEQFRRIANFYFLCLCIVHFAINSPVSPLTTLMPLVFVVVVTGFKQGYEDWKRHKEDYKINSAPALVIKGDELMEIQRSQIGVGDIVKVSSDEEFPCDLLFLASSGTKPKCQVTTANLDGETNLKTFVCPFETTSSISEEELSKMIAVIECQHPNPNLYDFKGRMEVFESISKQGSTFSLNTEQLLLRGTRLKNTKFIYGCAIYTGKETKMAMNSKMTISKFSTAEKTCNYFLLSYLAVLLLEVFVTTMVKYQAFGVEKTEDMWFIGPMTISLSFKAILQDSFSFFILFSYIIPISLYVTLEMQKFLGSFFFQWDEEMRCPETGENAICNTSDLNEELGQVKYLFTDKTGTLTENSMYFRQCSIGGVKFFEENGQIQSVDNDSMDPLPKNISENIEFFLITLALCHTVQAKNVFSPDEDNSSILPEKIIEESEDYIPLADMRLEYQASSPDEKALVEACALLGIVFEGEREGKLYLKIQGHQRVFERLEILEFDSDRKLMSVIVRDTIDDQIWVLSKGAENSVFKRCRIDHFEHTEMRDITMKHIDDFAGLGLRTLAIAIKKISKKEFKKFSKELGSARKEIQNREAEVRLVMDKIENGLTLLGATGVEDLLQDGVQETLESLAAAGIKIWVLTGDKIETAVNIAFLCGLFKKFMALIYLTNLDDSVGTSLKLEQSEIELMNDDSNFGLIVDGGSLVLLLEEFQEAFYKVCSQCSAVICCRMSPKQKAEIVKLVKDCSPKRTVCAAVGDGANDVSMIQEAHIGLGIMGKEGRQAVRCSDFALARFRFLQRAFLVHGHWYYTRISTLILYSFYKNVVFITPQVFFTFQSAFSTQSVYEGLVLTLINVTFSGLPIIIYGLVEQAHSAETLLRKPYLYKEITDNKNMSKTAFIMWTILGLWHASVMYFGVMGASYDTSYIPGGKNQDLFLYGMLLTTNVVFIINLKLVVESRYLTWLFAGSVILTIIGFYITYLIYCATTPTFLLFGAFYVMHMSPMFYFSTLLLVFVSLLPDIFIKIYSSITLVQNRFTFRNPIKTYFS